MRDPLGRRATKWILALPPLGLLAGFIALAPGAGVEPLRVSRPWVPGLGVGLSFYLDGLSLLFAILISGIGAVVVVYAGGYLAGHPQLGRFYAYLLAFMASMLGLVLADNLLVLFVFWELTSITSYLLIGFEHERPGARAAALQALLVTGAGGLALLAGMLLLGQAGGDLELSALLGRGDAVRSHRLYVPVVFLVLMGAFTKSAQVPFHFWLPAAMEAPTPVSAYLHSATMVKAGVYLLARLSPVLGGTALWQGIVMPVGAVTMLVGAYLAVRETDLKRLLAYTTVSALGTLTLLLGLGTPAAVTAAVVFLLGHALYKGALFLVAGAVDHATGARDVTALGGLARAMPITAVAAVLAALSMAAVPPMLGFTGKELVYEALVAGSTRWFVAAAVLANVLYVAAAGLAGLRPFVGRRRRTPKSPHEAAPSLWIGPMVLAALAGVAGLAPHLMARAVVAPAAGAVLAAPVATDLSLWHGLTLPLALGVLTLAGGVAVYAARGWLLGIAARVDLSAVVGPARGYELALRGLNRLATAQTRLLQNGYLRYYLLTIVAATVALVGYTLGRNGIVWPALGQGPRFYESGLVAVILLAGLAATVSTSRFGAVAALGAVGYGTAVLFILFGAPDLAITQVVVDTLTVILFVLVFHHLPDFARLSSEPARAWEAVVAVAAGGLVATLVLVATGIEFSPDLSAYVAEQSVPAAHGRNIVNVILVDFRALDTLGEITVLALAGLGVHALLRLRSRRRDDRRCH